MAESVISQRDPRQSIVQNVESSTFIEPAHRRTDEDKFLSLVKIYDQHERKKQINMQNYNMITNCKLKTEHENKEVVEKERSRRSRKDKQGRDHVCGCGKTYLSYPALYTHIKQKHQGKAPEGTYRMNSNGPSRRGRPRRERKQQSIHSIQENPTKNQLPRILKNMIRAQKLIIFQQYQELVRGTILPEQIKFPKFVEQIDMIKKEHPKQMTIEMSIDRVMAVYLHNMTDLVNQKFFEDLEEILVLLRTCINKHHNKLQQSYQKVSSIYTGDPIQQEGKSAEFSQTHSCEYLPLISEYFILKYIPAVRPLADQKLIVIVIQDFCQWLWANKLTHLRLTTYSIETIPNFSLADINCS